MWARSWLLDERVGPISGNVTSVASDWVDYLSNRRLIDQADGLLVKCWQLLLNHVPDDAVVDFSVGMDQNIAECNDSLEFAELRGERWINFGELRQGLAADVSALSTASLNIGSSW